VATPQVDVVIVGGGIAGLSCAVQLHGSGASFLLLEASDGLGGRMRTDQVEGFLLDRGFQVLLTAYPDAQRLLDFEALDLHELYPGALVRAEGRFYRVADPFRRPLDAIAAARTPVAGWRDYRALARLRARTKVTSNEQLLTRRESSALEILQSCGLSEQITERFFRPLLAGALLDPRLETSSRMLDFLLRMLGTGFAALPAGGMGSIPAQLAATLPGSALRLHSRVERLNGTAVVLGDGRIDARAVIVATEGAEAARLLSGAVRPPETRGVTCLYFAAPGPPLEGPVLVLDGDRSGPVNTLCVVSEVAPSYAPPGTALVAASVPGDPEHDDAQLEEDVRRQLTSWFGSAVDDWRHLRSYGIPEALPSATPPALELTDRTVRLGPGLYVCGDHRDTPSIQGALASGRRAAQAAVEDLRR